MNTEKQDRLAAIKAKIEEACLASRRKPSDVKLIAVSKTKTWEEIRDFAEIGVTDFGENYIQEALPKVEAIATWAKGAGVEAPNFHFIGSLQSNKAKSLPEKFSLFHALDSVSLAEKLHRACEAKGLKLNCLLEVNIDLERSKGGINPKELPLFLKNVSHFPALRVQGLMCIPTLSGGARRSFARLRTLMEESNLSGMYPRPLTELSMGMSSDFADAIREGSTMVRIGNSLFGERAK